MKNLICLIFIDLIVDELEVLIPSTEPRIRKLIRQLDADTGNIKCKTIKG